MHPDKRRVHIPALLLIGALAVLPACYRKEIWRKSYPGFAVETNADPAPTAKSYKSYSDDIRRRKNDPLAKFWIGLSNPFGKKDKESQKGQTREEETIDDN